MRSMRRIDYNFSKWTHTNDDNQSIPLSGSIKLHLNIPICSEQHLQFIVTGDLKQADIFSFPFTCLQHNTFRVEYYSSIHFMGLQAYNDLTLCFLLGCDRM